MDEKDRRIEELETTLLYARYTLWHIVAVAHEWPLDDMETLRQTLAYIRKRAGQEAQYTNDVFPNFEKEVIEFMKQKGWALQPNKHYFKRK
jgi:hypothetical protein